MTNCELLEKAISGLLKSCPFCGFDAGIEGVESGGFKVCCQNEDCGCSLPPWLILEKGENVIEKIALAIKYWNDRKAQ